MSPIINCLLYSMAFTVVRNHSSGKTYRRKYRMRSEPQSAEGSQQQNIGFTRESSLTFLQCFIVNIVLRHFVSVRENHSPGEITSFFYFITLKHLHGIIEEEKIYYLCFMPLKNCFVFPRSKQLIFNMT